VIDCVVRAIAIATNRRWLDVYDDLYVVGRREFDMPSSNAVWGRYLYELGFEPFLLPASCPRCVTIREFSKRFPKGVYIIGTGSHAVAVIDGDYYDSWDSGKEIPTFFWRIR
jgi:hypothetical protein